MKLSFHGAARTVTGSKHLLSLKNGTQILIDCGMYQGLGKRTEQLNKDWGFDPASINYVLLTHAHIDHSGLLPKLIKEGYKGKIYATEATMELTEILLTDSAQIQLYESRQQEGFRQSKGLPPYELLYLPEDVERTMRHFQLVPYDKVFELEEGIEVMFTNAGHLPGSACVHLTINEEGRKVRISFSGDVGRYRSVLLKPPAEFPQADYIVLESTYGNSTHDLAQSSIDPLRTWIKKTCVEQNGKLIIPAFSVGRTQEVLFSLNQLELEKRLPEVKYYVDSPLSLKATGIIKRHMDEFNERLQKILEKDEDPFRFEGLEYIEEVEDSKALVEKDEPCVIISASGTADAGRVRHHLHAALGQRNNSVLMVGYCPEESVGGQLLQGVGEIELLGESCRVNAEIGKLASMSAHGDSEDLLRYLSCQDAEKVKGVFLVHGEYPVQLLFAERLERKSFSSVHIPDSHQEYEL